ncbi:ANTAR domain-containing protein [Streptomyces sp. NPDC001795]|uniref:ANTAR domain-containing protein n=1 Tax=unclassified Streptomyces TaxID=2593676 RepID=UPI00332BA45B
MEKCVPPEPESPDGVVHVAWAHSSQNLLPPCLTVDANRDGDRVTVTVSGELDIDTEEALLDALRDALRSSVSGVDLDLGGVDFCDCSGLNVLLCIRRRALEDAKTVLFSATAPAVDRLLTLTGTRPLFGLTGSAAATTVNGYAKPTQGEPGALPEDERPDGIAPDLHIELVQLRRAMQTRPVIDLARGVLMASFALSAQDAWSVLVTISQKTNTKLHHVAEDLVAAVNGDTPPGPVQRELAEAVSAVSAVKEPSAAPPGTAG